MYRALYRKWRPQRFEDVVAQRGIVTALRNQIASGRVGHAYLFTGVRGTGKTIPPMVVLLVSLCLFRVVWIQFLLPFFPGIEGVFILYPVSWGLGAVLMILYAWKGKWMEYHT